MTNKNKSKGKKDASGVQAKYIWWGVGIAAIVFAVLAVFIWRRTGIPFEFVGGEKDVIVLLRNDFTTEYELRYTGNEPTILNRVVPMLEAPQRNLHVGVQQVAITYAGQEIPLDVEGNLPAGERITLQPGDTFGVQVTYHGETIGGNYFYGFRLGYGQTGQEIQFIIRDQEYAVFVE